MTPLPCKVERHRECCGQGQRRESACSYLLFVPSGKSASVVSWPRVFLDVLWLGFFHSSDHGG